MPSPYRESDDTPRAPLEELEWRRRVTRSALWAELFAVGEMALLLAATLRPARFVLPGAVAWSVMGAALVVATWMYTAPRPRSAVGWRGWLLRVSVALCVGVTSLARLEMQPEVAGYVLSGWLFVPAFGYASSFRRVRFPWSPRQWALTAAWLVVLTQIIDYVQSSPSWRIAGLFLVLAVSIGAYAPLCALLPVELQWWFDNQTGTPGEWVALLVYRDGPAEAWWIDERWFASKEKAVARLEERGYVPAERALAERLVARVPPDVLTVARHRKRRSVERSEPRGERGEPQVHVAPDASDGTVDEPGKIEELDKPIDGAIEELGEPALAGDPDQSAPERARAQREPHERRD